MATQTDALASVYARSLYQLAEEAGGREKILEINDELEQIADLLRSDKQFREFVASPIVDEKRRSESLRQIFSNRVTDLTLRFMLVLNDKTRLNHLEEIAAAYDQLVQEAYGRVEVDVFTPSPLDASDLEMLKNRIGTILKREPILHSYIEPEMIGGVKLRIGDQLIDGSLATKLRRMKESLLESGNARLRGRFAQIINERTSGGSGVDGDGAV